MVAIPALRNDQRLAIFYIKDQIVLLFTLISGLVIKQCSKYHDHFLCQSWNSKTHWYLISKSHSPSTRTVTTLSSSSMMMHDSKQNRCFPYQKGCHVHTQWVCSLVYYLKILSRLSRETQMINNSWWTMIDSWLTSSR